MGRLTSLLLTCAAAAAVLALPAASNRPLVTALYTGSYPDISLQRVADAGATSILVPLYWSAVAPSTVPTGFDATDPASPAYDWGAIDDVLERVAQHGLTPLVQIEQAPIWARSFPQYGVASAPDPVALGDFALAAARRYSGNFAGLPRVRDWVVWNEPNISLFFAPQFIDGVPFSPARYRSMVNNVYAAVKNVSSDNLVIAGGTAPFYDNTPEVTAIDPYWGPLSFLRAFLCLDANLKPACADPVSFDAWTTHPYTSGGPTHRAARPNDVSLGNLDQMRAVVDAGVAAGNVHSAAPPLFWVTEFGWDSNPPDPNGVPMKLLSRWVAEAIYRMWDSGVSLVTWFKLDDEPLQTSMTQSGLYYTASTLADETPKPIIGAFQFPFVAFPERQFVQVWGRTPGGRQASVLVQQAGGNGWTDLGTISSDANGVFDETFLTLGRGDLRAVTADRDEQSIPFSLTPVPDQVFTPFGGPPLEPVMTDQRPTIPQPPAGGSTVRIAAEQRLRAGGAP
jgi:hypothetical protein